MNNFRNFQTIKIILIHGFAVAFGASTLTYRLDPKSVFEDRRVRLIVQAAHLADVDPAELLAVCVLESGLRVRSPRASLCGCQPYATDDATQATCAARSYAAGLDRCGTPEGAVSRYVWGRCAPSRGLTPCRVRWRAHVLGYLRQWGRIAATLRHGEDEACSG